MGVWRTFCETASILSKADSSGPSCLGSSVSPPTISKHFSSSSSSSSSPSQLQLMSGLKVSSKPALKSKTVLETYASKDAKGT